MHQIPPHTWRTSSPLRAGLGFRYTQVLALTVLPVADFNSAELRHQAFRAAVGSRYGDILPAEGHLFDLLEPEDVVPAWKRWSPILLRPEGLYGTRPAEG